MGLDTVELVLDIEDKYQIDLPDAEWSSVRTVADVAALVFRHLPRPGSACPGASRFYELRRAFMRHARVDRRTFVPAAALESMLPISERRTIWSRIRADTRGMPRLTAPPWCDTALLWTFAVAIIALVPLVPLTLMNHVSVLWPLAVLIVPMIAVWLSRRMMTRFPDGIVTVRDLVTTTIPPSLEFVTPGERLIAQDRVLHEVRSLISENFGIPIERVRPESEFIRDLGMG